MTRGEMVGTLASVALMAADLVRKAEAETVAVSHDLASANATIDALRREIADYERTVAALREQLRAEEARRASYQAVDGVARRLAAALRVNGPKIANSAMGAIFCFPEITDLLKKTAEEQSA